MDPYHPEGSNLFILLDVFRGVSVNTLVFLIVILVLLIFSALFSGSETAFFSLNNIQLEKLRYSSNFRYGNLLNNMMAVPAKFIATLLIANSMVNIAIVILTTMMTESVFDFSHSPLLGLLFEIFIVTFLIVLFAEVIPKVYATKNNEVIAMYMTLPLYIVVKILSPLSWLLASSTSFLEKRIKKKGYNVSIDELTHAIDIASDTTTPVEEKKILKGIVKFGDIAVTQIMKQRPDIVSFEVKLPLKELLQKIIDTGYSRIPVFEENLDNIKGILHIKDLLPHINKSNDFNWQALIRKPFFVPESKKINDLLEEFQEKKVHMAIVIDEYGGTSGIVTLEDVLEEIVGELNDEFDDDEPLYSKLDDDNYVFEAKTLLGDVCRIMNIDSSFFDDVEGEKSTLAGLILELSGKIPDRNESIAYRNFVFKIESADKRKIKRVKVSRLPQQV